MSARRLPITPGQQHAVAKQAGVCGASVRRWLHGVDGLPSVDEGIRRALVALHIEVKRGDPLANVDAETRQLLMPVVVAVPPVPVQEEAPITAPAPLPEPLPMATISSPEQEAGWQAVRQVMRVDILAVRATLPPGLTSKRCRITLLDVDGQPVAGEAQS